MNNNAIIEKRYYRANDITTIFGIARSTVNSWSKQGILTPIKIGKSVFYSIDEVNRLAGVL